MCVSVYVHTSVVCLSPTRGTGCCSVSAVHTLYARLRGADIGPPIGVIITLAHEVLRCGHICIKKATRSPHVARGTHQIQPNSVGQECGRA
jgi:hypothetical protein